MKAKLFSLLISTLLLLSLCACAEAPQSDVVTSKNDGSFDTGVVKSADTSHEDGEVYTQQLVETFSSLDGSVSFQLALDLDLPIKDMPVVEVAPHTFTPEEAQRIAKALFGDVQFYETDLARQLSKDELRENITAWSRYLNYEVLKDLFNFESEEQAKDWQELVGGFIDNATGQMETAPDTTSKIPCQWTFKPDAYYLYTPEEINSMNRKEDGLMTISASAECSGVPYRFMISNRDEKDYKIHNIFAFINVDNSPGGIGEIAARYELCKSPVPTEEQLNRAVETVQSMLDNMQIGNWSVDECYYEPLGRGAQEAYVIYVNAVPIFEGIPAVRQPQLDNLKSTETYASNYYYSDANFELSPDGTVLSCTIFSPVDVVKVLNNNVQTLSFDELLEKVKSHLSLYDYNEYMGLSTKSDEEISCTVSRTGMEYGLTRVKVPDTNDSYYYVPAVTFRGNYQAYTQSGKLWFDSNDWWNGEQQTLLVLNAVDGSVINVSNGY